MWRPETNAEKNAREHPASHAAPVHQAPTMTPDQAKEVLQGTCWGSFFDCLDSCFKGVGYAIYVVCCCGCGTSYDEYYDD
ncbi:MAG: hypothetical protein H0U78_00520 [Rickettsiaceae bacterium]|jgi:hypothetical protein|nr:hypothetical protein [Rickettsiaceae bacterium]